MAECVDAEDPVGCSQGCLSRATARGSYVKTLGTPTKALHQNEGSYIDTAGMAAAAIAMVAVGAVVGAVIVRVRPAFDPVDQEDGDEEDTGRLIN